jgi:hypothetical protein
MKNTIKAALEKMLIPTRVWVVTNEENTLIAVIGADNGHEFESKLAIATAEHYDADTVVTLNDYNEMQGRLKATVKITSDGDTYTEELRIQFTARY